MVAGCLRGRIHASIIVFILHATRSELSPSWRSSVIDAGRQSAKLAPTLGSQQTGRIPVGPLAQIERQDDVSLLESIKERSITVRSRRKRVDRTHPEARLQGMTHSGKNNTGEDVRNCTDHQSLGTADGFRSTQEPRPRKRRKQGAKRNAHFPDGSQSNTTRVERPEKLEIVCKQCRSAKVRQRQLSMQTFLRPAPSAAAITPSWSTSSTNQSHDGRTTTECSLLICAVCRRSMEEKRTSHEYKATKGGDGAAVLKLKGYRKTAAAKGLEWRLSEEEATEMMTWHCVFCNRSAAHNPGGFNGINRLDHGLKWVGFGNAAAACSDCNQMKHNHSVTAFVQICRHPFLGPSLQHIATHNGLGEFGLFPGAFRDNFSVKKRSSYLTKSKTHALSHAEFERIVSQPCRYCGKQHEPGRHYNGLDRTDTQVRVYSPSTCVAACGTCNTLKWRRDTHAFLRHCAAVAAFANATHALAAPDSTARRCATKVERGGAAVGRERLELREGSLLRHFGTASDQRRGGAQACRGRDGTGGQGEVQR